MKPCELGLFERGDTLDVWIITLWLDISSNNAWYFQ